MMNIIVLVQIVWIEIPKLETESNVTYQSFLWWNALQIDKNLHLLLIVVFGGSLGALVDGLVSLVKSAKEGEVKLDQVTWHVIRPVVGAALAMAIYFAFRGGILTTSEVDVLNPYALATVAVIVGLVIDEAIEKLKKILGAVLGS